MKHTLRISLLLIVLLLPAFTLNAQIVALEPAWPDLRITDPVALVHAGDGSGRVFVVSQPGIIYMLDDDESVNEASVFIDLSGRVTTGTEMGLLSLAFHPKFSVNGYFYVNYVTAIGGNRRSVISRFSINPENHNAGDPDSEYILLEFNQPAANHNGGTIKFGPDDGYLYIASGDGGSSGDPGNNAQNRTNLLGAILRIDVDNPGNELKYGIPADNPFTGNTNGFRKEIYAWGLRNPWKMSFDPETGWLWAADVGQGRIEEINIIESGGNYGWRRMEGMACYMPETNCDTGNMIYPIWEYNHSQGRRSVTGGYVYRGASYPELSGKYIYGDYLSGEIWALEYDGENPPVNNELITADFMISSFGTDENDELYILAYNRDRIYRLISELSPVSLIYPIDGETAYPAFEARWGDLPGSDNYEILISTDEEMQNVVFSQDLLEESNFYTDVLMIDTERTYYWAVRSHNSLGYSESEVESFYLTFPVSIDEEEEIAHSVVLEQNYPNPFNSSTQIRYYLPEAMPVLLEVYSVNGQYITTLADGMRDGGEHVATFHAGAISTGIYISRLQAGTSIRIRKMLLIK